MTDMSKTAHTGGRAGGRGARRALRSAPDFDMWPALKRGIPECEVMDPARVEQIDNASMSILEEVGVIFRDDEDGELSYNFSMAILDFDLEEQD